ncbi:DUF485 domain-containing protein [Streptomyces bullii]|uniref:DUF485 domain-containing protein n=1 Tax=Streptomyces bullii TaxID=349910 RepID=A0ABW0V2D5_9ACTN
MPEFSPWSDNSFTQHARNAEPAPPPRITDTPEFRSLRHSQLRFGTRATALSVGGFLLYVLLSSFAPGVMNQPLLGRLTLGLTLGLGQFVVMAVTAWCYVRHMRTRVDPLARGLRSRLHHHEQPETHAHAAHPGRAADQTAQHAPRGFRTW